MIVIIIVAAERAFNPSSTLPKLFLQYTICFFTYKQQSNKSLHPSFAAALQGHTGGGEMSRLATGKCVLFFFF